MSAPGYFNLVFVWANSGGDISVFPWTLQGGTQVSSRSNYRGDTSVFPVKLQRGTQVSSREHYRGGDTSVFPVKLQGGHLDFFFVFLWVLWRGGGTLAFLKKIYLRKPTRKNFKNLGGKRSCHVDTQKSNYHTLQKSSNFHLSIMPAQKQHDNNNRDGRFKNHSWNL